MDKELVITAIVLTAVGAFFAFLGTGYHISGQGLDYNIVFSFEPFWTHPTISGATVTPVYYVNFVGVAQLVIAVIFYYMGLNTREVEKGKSGA
ncbi:MAG: hypothetical protein QW514_10140 [Thermoprotei archaeon]